MAATIESFGSSIVVLGNFNPPIFTPNWLNKNGLIGDGDVEFAEKAASLAITPDLSRFETEWFRLQVLAEQFSLTSKGALTPLLKDLAMSIFTIVDHTPVSAIGINFEANYKLSSADELHKIGDTLVPKNIWHAIYPESDHQSVGMANLIVSIDPCKREDKPEADIKKNISVRRSTVTPNGIFFSFNDHYTISKSEISQNTSANFVVRRIDEFWEVSMNEAKKVFETIIDKSLETGD